MHVRVGTSVALEANALTCTLQ